jgi:hypothetical protein
MSAALSALASTSLDVTTADSIGGLILLLVGVISFIAVTGLALSMTIGASKSPATLAITSVVALISLVIAVGLYITLTSAHGATPSTWDSIGSKIALLVGILASLTLGGLAVVMVSGALSPNKTPASSWSADLEASFSGYEQRTAKAQSQAWALGGVAAAFVAVAAIGIYKGVTPDIKDLTKGMNMSNLTKKSRVEAAPPAPKAPAAEAPEAAPKAPAAETPEAAPKAPAAETPEAAPKAE